MFDGTIDIAGIMLYKEEAKKNGKSEEYISALSDLVTTLRDNKKQFEEEQQKKLEILNKRRTTSTGDIVKVYHYERNLDGSISKYSYDAVEKKNSYEVKNCHRARLSKRHDINCFTDIFHHEMWTDKEADTLMEELLAKY